MFLIIIFILIITYFKYFNDPQKSTQLSNEEISINQELNSKDEKLNTIKNIEYIANDNLGNKYIINANEGYVDNNNSELIIMNSVRAEIIFVNSEKIYINANSAIYNTLNFNTQFRKNVVIVYGQHKIKSDESELIFSENLAKLNNNIIYESVDTSFFADKMEIDLITKDSKLYMNDVNKKIKVIHKNKNGYN